MRGRPKKEDSDKKIIRLGLRLTPDEYAAIKEAAEKERRTISNYICRAALEAVNR